MRLFCVAEKVREEGMMRRLSIESLQMKFFFMIHVYEINKMYFHFLSVGIRVE